MNEMSVTNSSTAKYVESSTFSIANSSSTTPSKSNGNYLPTTSTLNKVTCDEASLQRHLFKDYNINVRPVTNFYSQVNVTLGLTLRKIQHVDEINQAFTTIVNLLLYWTDQILTWDKAHCHGISSIEFPFHDNIWIPDLMIYNALKEPGKLGIKDAFVRLYDNGQIFVWTQISVETACEIKTKKYPFDVQICDIAFGKFISPDDKVYIQPLSENIDLSEYVNIAEWEIIHNQATIKLIPFNISSDILAGESAIDTLNYTAIIYTVQIRRSCHLCLHNAIIPVLILAILNLLTFFVPCESGEKTSYPISIFLTLAVFLTIITQSLPESVDGVSYLSSYVTFQLSCSAITLCCAIISLHLHYRKRNVMMPKWIHLLMCKFNCRRNLFAKEDKTTAAETWNLEHDQQEQEDKILESQNEEYDLDVSFIFDKTMFTLLTICEIVATIFFIYIIFN
ncbi:neuronal acetylcholine receptor subunit alpha-6-like [Ruditapes philippinarum]|uniref:neuronal acetylcholine receptor subunit alpha-6-like n=1 Tax=Ruditapes philippinarum TaxID=129788 RepID=UPI00295C09AD|nr:neuronal acetylcholine receptor subunit alpha-6-like [Ruditapes philippinarum]